jgi:hypothetical protein
MIPALKPQPKLPFVDTNVIPDRNAGLGAFFGSSESSKSGSDGPPLLNTLFAFTDVGVSRAKVATALKTLLANDLRWTWNMWPLKCPEAVPYANVTLLGARAEKIRGHLSGMSPYKGESRPRSRTGIIVVDRTGKVSSVAYSYHLYGNEVWEPISWGGRSCAQVTRSVLGPEAGRDAGPDVQKIEAMID